MRISQKLKKKRQENLKETKNISVLLEFSTEFEYAGIQVTTVLGC